MIGYRSEAAILAEWDMEYDEHLEWIPPADGWEYVGEGAERIVWRAPSGILYKVEQDGLGENHLEYVNIERLSSIPCQGWRLPKAELYEFGEDGMDILAMEFVDGAHDRHCGSKSGRVCLCKGTCVREIWNQMTNAWSITDTHTGNILVESDGTRVLVDVTG